MCVPCDMAGLARLQTSCSLDGGAYFIAPTSEVHVFSCHLTDVPVTRFGSDLVGV